LRSQLFARAAAVAAITALGGLGLAGLAPSASAAAPAKPYDFNGDGYQDLAVGSPYGKVGTKTSAGFVSVIYGSSKGFDTAKKKVFSQDSSGVPGGAEAYDHFGYSLASADFDRDGYADLAIGSPDEDTGKGANAGSITILWGTPSGLSTFATADEEIGTPGAGHRWGESMTAGDIEHDGAPELFVTVPGTGMFKWFYFNAAGNARVTGQATAERGMRAGGSQVVARAKHRKGGVSAQSATDVNSSLVAVGDVTGDGHDDMVYGWYDSDASDPELRRGFAVYPGTAAGDFDDSTSMAIVDIQVNSLAVADFNKDGKKDVAVGQPSDSPAKGGQVSVFTGSATGVTVDSMISIGQDTSGVPGAAAAGNAFGGNIAAGDVNKDGYADLAVGVANETVGSAAAGRAYVLFGSANGVTGTGAQTVSQSTTGVPGGSEKNDHFGYQVTLLDNNRDGAADLTIGAPDENGGDGAITFVKGGSGGVLPVSGSFSVGTGTFGVTGKKAELGRRLGH
jgi:hypothetical protein